MARTHRAGNTDLYGSAFENGAQIAAAIVKMRNDRAAQALRSAQQQAMQQRYLATQAQANERQTHQRMREGVQDQRYLATQQAAQEQRIYQRTRNAAQDKMAQDKFDRTKQMDAAAARAKMGPPKPTAAESYNQLRDVSANRYLNQSNPPSAVAVGPNADAANAARSQFFGEQGAVAGALGKTIAPIGPAQPFTGGVPGFTKMQKDRTAAYNAVDAADTGYDSALAKFPGVSSEFLDSVGDKVPYQLQHNEKDPKTGQEILYSPDGKPVEPGQPGSPRVVNYPYNEVAVRLPATLDNPSSVVAGPRKDWLNVLAARAKLAAMQKQQQALPQGYPASLPQPIAEQYPVNERTAMMPNAAQAEPAVGQSAPYQEPALPTKEAEPAGNYPSVDDQLAAKSAKFSQPQAEETYPSVDSQLAAKAVKAPTITPNAQKAIDAINSHPSLSDEQKQGFIQQVMDRISQPAGSE